MTSNTTKRSKISRIAMSLLLVTTLTAGGVSLLAGNAVAAGDVTITVTDRTGDAIEGADVVLKNAGDDSEAGSGTTDANGQITYSSQADGDYYANASAASYLNGSTGTITVSGSAASETVELREEPTELLNDTAAIDSETTSGWGEAELSSSVPTTDNNTTVDVTITGINSSSNSSTVLFEATTTASENSTVYEQYDLTDSELDEYDELRVVVEGNSEYVNATDYGRLESVDGGASGSGGVLDMTIAGIPLVVVLIALLGGFLILRDEGN